MFRANRHHARSSACGENQGGRLITGGRGEKRRSYVSSFARDKRLGRTYLEILSVTIKPPGSSPFYLLGRATLTFLFSPGPFHPSAISPTSPPMSRDFPSLFPPETASFPSSFTVFSLSCLPGGRQDSVSFDTRRDDWICKLARARAAAFDRREN